MEAILEGYGLSEGEAKSFLSQAVDLLNTLNVIKEKAISALIGRLGVVLSKLGISDSALETKLQDVMHQLQSGEDVKTLLQYFQAFIKDLCIPTADLTAFVGQLFEIVKSANVSIDAMESSGQLQDIIRGLNIFDADEETEIEIVESLILDFFDIADDVRIAYYQLVGLIEALGISKADVKFAVDAAMGFFNSLDFTDVMALLSDGQGLLIKMGIPSCGNDDVTMYFLKVFT